MSRQLQSRQQSKCNSLEGRHGTNLVYRKQKQQPKDPGADIVSKLRGSQDPYTISTRYFYSPQALARPSKHSKPDSTVPALVQLQKCMRFTPGCEIWDCDSHLCVHLESRILDDWTERDWIAGSRVNLLYVSSKMLQLSVQILPLGDEPTTLFDPSPQAMI